MTAVTPIYKYKRKRLLTKILLLAAGAAGVQALLDIFQGELGIILIDLGLGVWLLFLCWLNVKGFHSITRYTGMLSMSLALLIICSMIPKENGLHLYFLPLTCVAFVIFDHEQFWGKVLVSVFILCCYLLLEVTDYRLLGDVPMIEDIDRPSYITNYLTSGALLILALSFIARANHGAEQHLEKMAEEIQQQNGQLSKANQELDRFVYSTSHDLRAPLLSVLGLVQLIESRKADEPEQPYLDMMRNRINKLVSFINDITAYSRNARLPVQLESLHLHELGQEVISSHQYLYHDRQLDFRNEIQINEAVLVDRQRVLTILNNLFSNAIRYHRMQHENPFVALGVNKEDQQLHFWVTDNGPGIAPAVQERMFEMFFRGDDRSGGSGLGLYIVKEAVEKLKGKIEVDSTVGKGTTFHIWIPLESVVTSTTTDNPEPVAEV